MLICHLHIFFSEVFVNDPCGSAGKESAYNAGDLGSIPGLGRSPGEGTGHQLQYPGLENSMDCIIPNGGEDVEQQELSLIADGNAK